MELVDNRYADVTKMGGPARIADNVLQAALVIGTEIKDWQKLDFAHLKGSSTLDGKELANGTGSAVMGGALITAAIGYRIIFGRRQAPIFDTKFHLPTSNAIDAKLIGGSALFGIGWGIAGFCPGPGLVSMAAGEVKGLVFVLAMLMGMVVFEWLERMSAKTRTT